MTLFEVPTLDTLWANNLELVLPAIWLLVSVLIVLVIDLFSAEEQEHWTSRAALIAVVISFALALRYFSPDETTAFGGMFVADALTGVLNLATLGMAFLVILISTDHLKRINIHHGEFYALVLLSTGGVMFMIGANDLLVIFVALELLSIPLYILAAFRATNTEHISRQSGLVARGEEDINIVKSEESGMKYFILGAFSSAFFVYGAALIYGATGTTHLPAIFDAVRTTISSEDSSTFLLLAGAAMTIVGLGFKVAAVPFHMWTPDVYEGSPTPVTAFMSVAAKIGGFAALIRLLLVGLPTFVVIDGSGQAAWLLTIQIIAAATLIVGNFVAISQSNVKRMLGYSSIAHAGYLLIAIAAAGESTVSDIGTTAAQAIAFYLIAYMFTNLGAFAVIETLENEDGSGTNLSDFNGLYNSKPLIAIAMAVFMLSLTGIPLTGGFIGKWLVFNAAVQANLIILAVIGVLTSVISAFYYVRVIVNMFLRTEDAGSPAAGATQSLTYAIYASMAGVMITGIIVPLVTNLTSQIAL